MVIASLVQGACLLVKDHAFVPILKNASSSMGQMLSELGAREGNFVTHPTILNEFKLAVILRDPVDRFISIYNFVNWLEGTPDDVLDDENRYELYTPQTWFLAGAKPDLVIAFPPVDFMGERVPHVNKGGQERFQPFDSPELRARIQTVFAEDQELFNTGDRHGSN